MKLTWTTLTIIGILIHFTECSKILVVIPMPSKSHTLLGEAIVKNLIDDGHEVTYITPILMKNPPNGVKQVNTSSTLELLNNNYTRLDNLISGSFSTEGAVLIPHILFHYWTKAVVLHENVQNLINDPNENFDLVIAEFLYSSLVSGFSSIFQCPLIWFVPCGPFGKILRIVDEYPNPSYVADINSLFLAPLTFWQRTKQAYAAVATSVISPLTQIFFDNPVYNEAFTKSAQMRSITLPTLAEAELSASLVLGNSHISLTEPMSLPANYINIGGFHINDKPPPLPESLQKIMDDAKDGVIYFSMGSNLKSKDLPNKMKIELLHIFGQLKQTVLWKFEEQLNNLPKNVHILEWAPQHSILAHPNIKIFITHGGQQSIIESIHFGVPIIGIPAFGDQFVNINKAVLTGYCLKVELGFDIAERLQETITEMISNTQFSKKIKELTTIYHDRAVSPKKEMIHWVNHVLKTKGAPHLRSKALITPWYQKVYLDLMAFIALIFYAVYKLITKYKRSKKVKVN